MVGKPSRDREMVGPQQIAALSLSPRLLPTPNLEQRGERKREEVEAGNLSFLPDACASSM